MSVNQSQNDKAMNVIGHIAELRNRLIVTAIFFVLFFIVSFIFIKDIYYFFENDIPFDLHITSITDPIRIYINMAGIVALVGTLPILCFQLWLFIKPGLSDSEKKASLSYIPPIFFLFIFGLIFGYLLFIHFIVPFLVSINDGTFQEIFTVDKYFGFMFRMVLPLALIFEAPIISMFLTRLGIVTPQFLSKIRKYAYFLLLVAASLLTPPDLMVHLVVTVPLFLIYEISIFCSKIVYRKKQQEHEAFMKN